VRTHGHIVTVGARPSVAGELSILVDDTRGVTMALEHLVALGHRSIGYIRRRHLSVSSEPWEDHQRGAAYRGFLSARGLPYTPEAEVLVTNEIDRIDEIQQALRRLLALPQGPTAVFVNDDTTAIITIKAALTCGIRVPDDLSIVGFDDLPSSALYTPGLTTVHQPVDAMGRYAATILLDRISGVETAEHAVASLDSNTLLFPPTLVCRESATRVSLPT
jgi:LacI family transcriptional regulator